MIRVQNLSVEVAQFSLNGVSLDVPTGQYAILMGKTGSGKTTLLECLCGLRTCRSGRVLLSGRDVTGLRPAERDVGYVPQDGALFMTMTVARHLALPLEIRRWSTVAIRQRISEISRLLEIESLLDRRPVGLSGGEIQRVALGRALAFRPSTLLLDEPLSALDDATRGEMYRLLKSVQRQTQVTALHVTHSREEAAHLADRLLILTDNDVHVAPLATVSADHSFLQPPT